MPTVVDSLVVTLGLDATAYTSGSKAASAAFKTTQQNAQKSASNIEASGKQAALFFSKLRNEALTFFAVFTAGVGFKDFLSSTIVGSANLGRMAANLNMSTRDLSAWQKAAERAGGTAEGMTAQLKESASESAKYRTGIAQPDSLAAFARYGGHVSEYATGNRLLLERSRIISEIFRRSPAEAALAAQQLGISEDTFNLIKQGPAAVMALVDAQKKNSVVTEADAKKAQELQNRLLDLRDTLQATATKVVIALMPAIEALVARFQKFADWALDHKDDIAAWVTNAVNEIIRFAKEIDSAVESVGGWKLVLEALIALKLTSFVGSLFSMAAAIAAIGRAVTGASAAGAATGAGSLAGFIGGLAKGGIGLAALTYSSDLNSGEPEELAKRRAMGDKDKPYVGTPGGAGSTQATVIDSLMAKGWTRAQAAGIAANLKQESSYNPSSVGDNGQAYGIAQWHPDRQAAFKAKYGKDIQGSTLEEQLAFLDYELRNGGERRAGDMLKQQTGAGESAAIVSQYYERPKDRLGEAASRARMAEAIAQSDAARSAAWAASNANDARSGAAGGGRGGQGGASSTEVNIGKIEVHTQATDAAGIARDLAPSIRNQQLAVQANTGLQ